MTLASKLNPAQFSEMSTLMAAITGYILKEAYTEPEIAQIAVSEREQLAYIRTQHQVGYNTIVSLRDLRRNWNGLLDAAELTPDERRQAERLFRERVLSNTGT
jgi:hypothetical protein